jgi:hypothetical protein
MTGSRRIRLSFAKTQSRPIQRAWSHLSRARVCWAMVARIIHVLRLLIVLASRHRSLVLENLALEEWHAQKPPQF